MQKLVSAFVSGAVLIAASTTGFAQRSTPVTVVNGPDDPVPVISGERFEFVGLSTRTLLGGGGGDPAGLNNYKAACEQDFGSEARWCTSVQILATPRFPLTQEEAWVRPVLQVAGRDADSGFLIVLDASGISNIDPSFGQFFPGQLSCNGWGQSSADFTGLSLSSGTNTRFTQRPCNTFRSVACCAPAD